MAMFGGIFGKKPPLYPQGGMDPNLMTPPYAGGMQPGYPTPPSAGGMDTSIPQDPYAGQRPNGGILGTGASWGDIGKGAAIGAADGLANYFGAEGRGLDTLAQQQQQQAEAAQAERLAILKSQIRQPTALQQNYEYLKSVKPEYGDTYLASQANPVTLMSGPNGELGFFPKAGMMGGAAPTSKTLPDGTTAFYVPNGVDGPGWYDNAEGR